MHLLRSLSGAVATAAIVTFVGMGNSALGDDVSNPQTTIDGCQLQGGCAAEPTPEVGPAQSAALDWARSKLGAADYDGFCQRFVHDAYLYGAGVEIGVSDANAYWNNHPELQHPGDTNPPPGALVYWGPTPNNEYGHVALAEGGDTVISSTERSTHVIHEFSIADRNSSGYYPYQGWLMPA